jgi:hypothetical protein
MSRSKKDPQAMENSQRAGAAVLPVCSICNQVPELGIRGVIRVGKAWLCQTCELEITLLEVGSAEYGVMLKKIKKVWE